MPHPNHLAYEFGPYRFSLAQRALTRDGEVISLTPKAFEILTRLVVNAGQLLEKDDLLKEVWPDTFVEEANLTQYIFTLRRALGDERAGPRYIETVSRRGYRFVADVRVCESDAPVPSGGAEAESQPDADTDEAVAPRPVVAVLPFVNETGDEGLEYLAEGVTDNIINNLSRVSRMRVMSRSAVFRRNAHAVDPQTFGKELGATAVLVGKITSRPATLGSMEQGMNARPEGVALVTGAGSSESVKSTLTDVPDLALRRAKPELSSRGEANGRTRKPGKAGSGPDEGSGTLEDADDASLEDARSAGLGDGASESRGHGGSAGLGDGAESRGHGGSAGQGDGAESRGHGGGAGLGDGGRSRGHGSSAGLGDSGMGMKSVPIAVLGISVELVEVATGFQIWGESFDCASRDLLQIQDAITRQLLINLKLKLTGEEEKRVTARYTENAQAYQAYLEGRYHWSRYTRRGIETAIKNFRRAIELDSNYALAYSAIVDCYLRLATNYLPQIGRAHV